MDLVSQHLLLGSGSAAAGGGSFSGYRYSNIDAVNGSASGTGTLSGVTGTTSQSTYRHAGFSSSQDAIWEWRIDTGFANSNGFVGLMDLSHWNGTPSFSGSTGERMMYYVGNSFSYGENTGTTYTTYGTGVNTTFSANDILGQAYNRSNGKLAYYKNGTLFLVQTNTGTTSLTLYPAVSMWTASMGTTMLSTASSYYSNYTLPT